MTAVERYNALDGKIAKREELQKIAVLGAKEGQTKISLKLFKLLEENDDEEFKIKVGEFALDRVPEDSLKGLDFAMPEEDLEGGLERAVAPDDIYQMITDKMIKQLENASGKDYKKKWRDQNDEGYLLPFNFDTKKMYRGINIPLLTEGMSKVLKNPFFLTFNQIEKNKGKLKKGSKGFPVVYFTMLYAVKETGKDGEQIDYGTYNKKKFLAWLNKNHTKLRYSKDYYKNSYIPILKYYNVFNGADVEGIDFDLDNFKVGYQDGTETIKNNDSRVEIADLIVKNYPTPQPKLMDTKKGGAYYSHNITGSIDEIHMPKFEDFETGLDYYRTLFHEFTHSTGVKKRLDRDMKGKFGSKPYAKEELVAEFGAIFLSAHAGIIWYNQKNHAEYLKNWNNALTHIKDDNRFIMRAASKAQEAADFILNQDKNGVPAYQNSLKSEAVKNADPEKKKKSIKSKYNIAKINSLKAKYLDRLDKSVSHRKAKQFLEDLEKKSKKNVEMRNRFGDWLSSKSGTLELKDLLGQVGFDFKNNTHFNAFDTLDSIQVGIQNGQKKLKKKKPEVGEQLGLFGAVPKKPTLKETLKFAESHLIGKSFFVDALGEEVYFTKPKLKKAMSHPRASNENLALVYKLPAMLEKAVLLSEQPDKKKRKEIKKVFKLVLIEKLFGKIYRVLITIRKQDKNYYYDHAVIEKIEPEKQDGSVNKVNPIPLDVASPVPGKDKKKTNSQKKGLNSPVTEVTPEPIEKPVEAVATVKQPETRIMTKNEFEQEAEKIKLTKVNSKVRNLADRENEEAPEYFNVPGEPGKFLQGVEKKKKESVVITMDGQQGAGKTTTLYKFMDAFAAGQNPGIFFSLEEHYKSALATEKRDKYLSPENQPYIDIMSDLDSKQEFYNLIEDYDIIYIDSWQKLLNVVGNNFRLDADLRKKFDGKVFVIIFQQTTDGKTKGGAQIVFDGDMIMKMIKEPKFSDNYAYWDKNRYTKVPLETLRYNIAGSYVYNPESGNKEPEPENEIPSNSRVQKPESGRLIATPIF